MSILAYIKEKKEKVILLSILLWILGIVVAIFYVLSYILTIFGSLFLFCVLLYVLFYLGTRLATFPGAYIFWLRIIERSNLKTVSSQACKKLEILTLVLLFIKEANFDEIFKRLTFNTLKTIPKTFEKIMKNLEALRSQGLSDEQEFLVENFGKLLNCLAEIKFKSKNKEESLYDFLLKPESYREIVFTNINSLNEAFMVTDLLYENLRENLKDPESFKDLLKQLNFKAEVTLGSIDYMRNDLIDKMKAENIWVTSEDGNKIDW